MVDEELHGRMLVSLVESCVPPGLVKLGPSDGMPPLPLFDLSLVTAPGEPSHIVKALHDLLAGN